MNTCIFYFRFKNVFVEFLYLLHLLVSYDTNIFILLIVHFYQYYTLNFIQFFFIFKILGNEIWKNRIVTNILSSNH